MDWIIWEKNRYRIHSIKKTKQNSIHFSERMSVWLILCIQK